MQTVPEVRFDLDCTPLEREFLKWLDGSEDKDHSIKRCLIVGYFYVTRMSPFPPMVEVEKNEKNEKNVEDQLRKHYDQLLERETGHVRKLLKDARDNFDEELTRRLLSKDAELSHVRASLHNVQSGMLDNFEITLQNKLLLQNEKFVKDLAHLTAENTFLKRGFEAEESMKLKRELDALTFENETLKKTNIGKGNLGECNLMNHIRDRFNTFEIRDASKETAACDIHVFINSDDFFAVESKNKSVVTALDVAKFKRDVEQLATLKGKSFIGGLFVSLNSANIPGKGDFFFDVVHGRPVIYVGFVEFDGDFLRRSIVMLLQSYTYLTMTSQGATSVHDLLSKLQPLVAKISKARKDVGDIKSSASSILRLAEGLDGNLTVLFMDLEKVIGREHVDITPPKPRRVKKTEVKT